MKFLKNAAPLALACVIMVQGVPVFGEGLVPVNNSKPVSTSKSNQGVGKNSTIAILTVDEATKKAIDHNEAIKKSINSEDLSDEAYKDYYNAYNKAQTLNGIFTAKANLVNFELSRSLNIKNITAQKENVEFSVIQLFNTILNAEKNLELYDEQIKLSQKNMEISKLKLDLGLVSSTDYNSEKLIHDQLVNNRSLMVTGIDNAYRTLNQTMGQDLDNKYKLELSFEEYKELEEINITTYTSKFINESLEVKQAENAVEVAKITSDNYVTPSDPMTNEISVSDAGRIEADQNYVTALRNKTTVTENVKKSVLDNYNTIRDLELEIKLQILAIENDHAQLEIAKKQLSLGQTTQVAIDKMVYDIAKKENTLREDKNRHTLLVKAFKNPNLLSSGVESTSGASKQQGAGAGSAQGK